jgi:hypothetical protein
MTCLRKYFWRRILNLESNKLNNAFWYGGVLGAGFEAYLLGKNPEKAMDKEDRRRRRGKIINPDDEPEMAVQRRLISHIINEAKKQPDVKKMRMTRSQAQFKVRLKDSGLWLCGTDDGEGTYAGSPCAFEEKTAIQVNAAYITSLSFDPQIHSYAYARRLEKKPPLAMCCYCIFQKVKKYVKKKQTVDDFCDREIPEDLATRPEFYYHWIRLRLGRLTVSAVGHDIEREATILKSLYDSMSEKEILDPHNWPRRRGLCSDWKGCEFLSLCRRPAKWKLYLRFFKQREMMYEIEKQELQK